MSVVSQAYRLAKPWLPGVKLVGKFCGSRFAKQVEAIVGGNPATPNSTPVRVALLCLPVFVCAITTTHNANVMASGMELSKRLLTVTGSSAQMLTLLSKKGVRLKSHTRYALFFMVYSVWSVAAQISRKSKKEGR